jgi:membrane protein DedA with SNARE-associated domain
MLSNFLYSFLNYPYYILYGLIFFLMIFMGEEALLVIGALARLGYIDFWDAFLVALLGVFAGDFFWYKIGVKYGEKFVAKYGGWFFMTPERFNGLKNLINKNGGIFIFFSKFMYNLNHISLVAAGAIGFNFRRFIRYQILVSFVWVLSFISLGYFFAHNLVGLKHDVTLFTIVLLLVFAAFIVIDRFIEKLLEKKLIKFNHKDDSGLSP